MAVTIGPDVLFQYRGFTLYNSPYVAHDHGCAIDLYPAGESAPSPVAGEVVDTRRVDAPPKPYAAEHDYLILVDTGSHVARLLHVEPAVEPGERIDVGESLGTLVRAGFFAPWVSNHVHLGFRNPDANAYRASGSLPIRADVDVTPVSWDGTGTVVDAGETWALLGSPAHPDPGEYFVGLESDGGVLDGGFPHYENGGLFGDGDRAIVSGTAVGTVSGRDVSWHDCVVYANGTEVTGLALFVGRDEFGIKLVGHDVDLRPGQHVDVTISCKK